MVLRVVTLQEALAVVTDVALPGAGILVDSFHFYRNRDRLSDLAGVDPSWLPYMQLCDAPWSEPDFAE